MIITKEDGATNKIKVTSFNSTFRYLISDFNLVVSNIHNYRDLKK